MISLSDLKEKESKLKELVSVYEKISRLKELDEEELAGYEKAKSDLKSTSMTIMNLETEIEYTEEEMNVFLLPEKEQENAWFELFKKCDFSKDSILRICSMLKADGLLPMFKSKGVYISSRTAAEALALLEERNFKCLSVITKEKLFEVKSKVKNKEELDDEELIYKVFLDEYDDINKDYISNKCVMQTYEYFTRKLADKYHESNNIEDRADYLVDRIVMELGFGGVLASGEKEFIALYFKEKKEKS